MQQVDVQHSSRRRHSPLLEFPVDVLEGQLAALICGGFQYCCRRRDQCPAAMLPQKASRQQVLSCQWSNPCSRARCRQSWLSVRPLHPHVAAPETQLAAFCKGVVSFVSTSEHMPAVDLSLQDLWLTELTCISV